jgi:hypothetical protein
MVESSQQSAKTDEAIVTHTEAELEILAKFFVETCHQLLGVNKDLINHQLHPHGSFEILNAFASDKSQRTLVFSKVERTSSGDDEIKQTDPQEKRETSDVRLVISNKVEYQGASAQAIAFLKREPYKHLYLKDQDKLKIDTEEKSTATTAGDVATTMDEEFVDLSSQLQVINLGYIGPDSNIFELASTYVDFSILPLFQDYKSKSQG